MSTVRTPVTTDRATRTALMRWAVIAEVTDERLGGHERGRMIGAIARRTHRGVDGATFRVTTRTVYRWLGRWRDGGFDALKPQRRSDAGTPRTDPGVLELAAALRREAPARSAAHIAEILGRTRNWEVSARTLQRHFDRQGLDRARLEGRTKAFGRFEKLSCGDLWISDAWDGPPVAELGGRHAQLFTLLDDHSRLVPHGAFYANVGAWSFQRCFKTAIARRGLPRVAYFDNGAAYQSGQLKLICARLNIAVTHSAPYRPQGRGKKERFYRTVAEQFAVEIDPDGIDTLAQLNGYFVAWLEQVYHPRIHGGTGMSPLDRWTTSPSSLRPAPDPETLRQAFLWHRDRTVTKTRTVSLHGNTYEVDPSLAGAKVTLVFDPTDLTRIDVVHNDVACGTAVPFKLKTHIDPALRDLDPPPAGTPTGVNYLDAVAADHAESWRGQLTYQPNHPDPHDDIDTEDLP